MSTIYHSRFLKADARLCEMPTGGKMYTSQFDKDTSINDVYLNAGASLLLCFRGNRQNLLIPIVGTLIFTCKNGTERLLSPGDVYSYSLNVNEQVIIRNSHKNETINFIHVCVIQQSMMLCNTQPFVAHLPITAKNCLVSGSGFAENICVGVYDSRVKGSLSLSKEKDCLIAYVINGSFEFQERLMEHRDALMMWQMTEIDFEALSEAAILLLIKCSHSK